MEEIGRTLSPEEKQALAQKPIVPGQEQKVETKVEQKVETKQEETKPEIKEVKEETKEEVKAEEKPKVEEKAQEQKAEPLDIVSVLNKELGREFKDTEEIKSFLEKAGRYDELKTSNEEVNQKLKEYQKLAEGLDPLSYFASTDEYIRQQFLKNNKDKLGKEAIDALSSLSPEKVKQLSEVDALKTDLIVNKGLTSEEAQAYLLKHYEIDSFDTEELDAGTKAEIKVDVLSAKERISKMYEGIDVPTKVDWESSRTQLKEAWASPLSELEKGINKIELDEGIDLIVDEDMKAGIANEVMSKFLTDRTNLSEQALAQATAEIKDKIITRNMDKVIATIRSEIREQEKAALRAEVHNDKPLNTESKTVEGSLSNDEKVLRAWR